MSFTLTLQLDTQAAAQAAYETHVMWTRMSTAPPAFDTLPPHVQEAWCAIARAVFAHVSQKPASVG